MTEGVELATAYISIVPEGSKIAPEIKRQFGAAGVEAKRAGSDSGKRFSSGFGSAVKGLAVGFAGAKVLGFLNDSVGAASDLNETTSMSAVIFGKNAEAVEKWASTSATSFGLSKQAALQAAGGLGDMFLQLGLADKQAVRLSKSTVQMAADLGSFKNLETDDVLDRISAALRGEYDSLQAVIPNINAARVEQEALAATGKKSAKELTAAEKATATLAIIQKDGARAAGNFKDTSDDLANSQKIQAASAEDLKAKIGTGLLPIQLRLTRFLADDAIPAISDFVTGMQDGTGAGGEFADIVGDVVDTGKDLVGVGKDIVGFFNSLPGPVKDFAIQGGIALAVFKKFSPIIGSAGASIGTFSTGSTAKLKQLRAEMTYAETRLQRVGMASRVMGGALTNVAGAGGMLLLANSTQQTNKTLAALEGAAGGALSGAALGAFGGPPGAAIGAGIGALAGATLGLFTSTKKAGSAAADAIPQWSDYQSTLDDVTGSVTGLTRSQIAKDLQDNKVFETTRKLGLKDREVVTGLLRSGKARDKVSATIKNQLKLMDDEVAAAKRVADFNRTRDADAAGVAVDKQPYRDADFDRYQQLVKERDAQKGLLSSTLSNIDAVKEDIRLKREQIAAGKDYGNTLDALPSEKRVKVLAEGIIPTEKGIANVANKIKATDEEINVLIQASGVKTTLEQIKAVIAKLREVDRIKATAKVIIDTVRNVTNILSFRGPDGGADGDPSTPGRRLGGPVRKGEPYIVGERRPELFVPNQSGRILANVPTPAASAAAGLSGARLRLNIGGRDIEGVLEEIADSRVDAAYAHDGMLERAFT